MDNLLEHTLDAERHAKAEVAENVFAAKIFRFVFKDILDKLFFVHDPNLKHADLNLKHAKWYLYSLNTSTSSRARIWSDIYANTSNGRGFFMYLDFTEDQIERLGRYFSKWKNLNASRHDFSYSEFPLKTMIESAIGKTILHFLDTCDEQLRIYLDQGPLGKHLLFSASSAEEIMMKMDLAA